MERKVNSIDAAVAALTAAYGTNWTEAGQKAAAVTTAPVKSSAKASQFSVTDRAAALAAVRAMRAGQK